MRLMVALGGNAMTGPGGRARPEDQIAAAGVAGDAIAGLHDAEVVVTHGNGPQVGNLLVKNELAAHVVPPVPLDWCGAQTQATLGFVLLNALDAAHAARGVSRPVAAVVTRTLVDDADPGFGRPTKPIGRYVSAAEAQAMVEHGETWEDRGDRGWRRVVASPEPVEVLDAGPVAALLASGYVVVAAGGGGIPVVRTADGRLEGVEAVVDKDLAAALLAQALTCDLLVVATDVPAAMLGWGTPEPRPLGRVRVTEARAYAAEGHFASGSMGPKVEAACRFAAGTGSPAVITSLDHLHDTVAAATGRDGPGTVVVPD
jgi:carbamate kinase